MKKTSTLIVMAAMAIALAAGSSALSQSASYGKISSVNMDGTITIDAGQNAGFESGDVLVIQRQGMKVGLAHISKVDATQASAEITKTEGDAMVKTGDLVAYELLSGVGGYTPSQSYTSYTTNVETQMPANIMKDEWLSKEPPMTDYDSEISKQMNALAKNSHNRSAMIRLADAYFKKSWFVHSVKWNQRAIEEKPNAPDNDKLIYQIVRAYGYLNEPEKQMLYMNYLEKQYPTSIFVSLKSGLIQRTADQKLLANWQHGPITDDMGFQKGGMRILQTSKPEEIRTPGSDASDVGNKLFHGSPELFEPATGEPNS